MSLLNDALRNAEQRQKGSGPAAPGVYTGTAVLSGQSSRWPLILAIVLLVTSLAGAGAWFGLHRADQGSVAAIAPAEPGPTEATGRVLRDSVQPEAVPEVATEDPPAREPVIADPEPAPEQAQKIVATAQTVQPEPAVQDHAPEPKPSAPEPGPVTEDGTPLMAVDRSDAGLEQVPAAPAGAIKQTGQSPEARDREASRVIRDLLADGRSAEAVGRLEQIAGQQAAPLSRRVMVRHLLANNQAEAALEWVSASVADGDSELRLLRARALLSVGQPGQALSTLTSRVPPIEEHAAYRVTLATVLQQQGRYSDAANQWGALIAWDDSRAPWWAGLAMTLEAQGNHPSAVRAYRQAASLPGLSAELADYVRQRLQALQAG
jgi:MSHA biogenesis protein MshN